MAARMAMMAMTTNSSISVNAFVVLFVRFMATIVMASDLNN
jgi:hypothetical protein